MNKKVFLVTGSVGFIGYHLSQKLLSLGHSVIGIDCIDSHYDRKLKLHRQKLLKKNKKFIFYRKNIGDRNFLVSLFKEYTFQSIFHLAATPGVFCSNKYPFSTFENNVGNTMKLLDSISKLKKKPHFFLASSSSVYGISENKNFSESDTINTISHYAASKASAELVSQSYSNIYNIPTTVLRYFNVYGPLGRPDTFIHLFINASLKKTNIALYNHGRNTRDFTYIDDAIEATLLLANIRTKRYQKNIFCIFNVGRSHSVSTKKVSQMITQILKSKNKVYLKKARSSEPLHTKANIHNIKKLTGFSPKFDIGSGLIKTIAWHKDYYAKP